MNYKFDNNIGQDKDYDTILELSDRLRRQKKIDVEKNWKILDKKIHQGKKKNMIFFWMRNVAAAILLPLLAVTFYYYNQTVKLKSIPVNQLELVAAFGTQTKVVLSDGSEIWLNSGSKLIYPDRFVGDHRQVILSGEAFFKVSSDKNHRFDVSTPEGIVVSAYGTEFNVEAYEEEGNISATLVNGSIGVEVPDSDQKQFVQPGEQLVYSKETKEMHVSKVNVLTETGWKEGKLVFRRTPMIDVVNSLIRKFNVDIELRGEELYDYSYSATFTTESLSEILSLLEKTAPIKCLVIKPKLQGKDHEFTKKRILIYKK